LTSGLCNPCTIISTQCLVCANNLCSTCSIGYLGTACSSCSTNYGYSSGICTPCASGFSSLGGTASCFNNAAPLSVNSNSNTS
jgi:hypothetical protein